MSEIFDHLHYLLTDPRIIIVCQMEEELLYRNHFFTDGQTDGQRPTTMVKPVYLHNFDGGGIQTYFQCRKIVEK